MRTVGIVAEYNPFHSGHKYHMEKAKELAAADYAIVVMSPDFVQRGEPAVFDKYTRTKMALAAGADLVVELPVCFATGSAEYFTEGAVQMLDRLGVTDALCFGSESVPVPSAQADTNAAPSIAPFQETARILLEEPVFYKKELQRGLGEGLTFPQARATALLNYQEKIREASETTFDGNGSDPGFQSVLLSSPNNILGVEYCKALQKFHSRITPIALTREGSEYSSSDFGGNYCSAKALRKYIRENPITASDKTNLNTTTPGTGDTRRSDTKRTNIERIKAGSTSSKQANESDADGLWMSALSDYVPSETQALFSKACRTPIFPDVLLPFLTQKLLFETSYDEILDISPDLARRIEELRFSCIGKSFEEITVLLKTRQMTQTRIQRALLHLILDIRKKEVDAWRAQGTVFYAHVLGFRHTASPLLHEIKKRSTLPLITKAAHAPKILSGDGLQMWKQDVTASHLYRSLVTSRYGLPFRTEYEISPVIL